MPLSGRGPDHAAECGVLSVSGPSCEAAAMTDDEFQEPWFRPDPKQAHAFESEVNAEVSPGHELHGLTLYAVATCAGYDEVVFRASDDTFAVVHLTWTQGRETPPWPQTTRLGGFVAVEAAMEQHGH
jgi:hypothetical protein